MPDIDDEVAEIEQDLAVRDTPLSTILEKWIRVAERVGHADDVAWATRELLGYRPNDAVPAYRMLDAPICVSGIRGTEVLLDRRVGPLDFPQLETPIEERVAFRAGVRGIEVLLQREEQPNRDGTIKVEVPHAMHVAALIDNAVATKRQLTTEVFYAVSAATVRDLLDDLRTMVADFLRRAD